MYYIALKDLICIDFITTSKSRQKDKDLNDFERENHRCFDFSLENRKTRATK